MPSDDARTARLVAHKLAGTFVEVQPVMVMLGEGVNVFIRGETFRLSAPKTGTVKGFTVSGRDEDLVIELMYAE